MQGLRVICATLVLTLVSAGGETAAVGDTSLIGQPFPLSPSVARECSDLTFEPCALAHRLLSLFAQEPRDEAWAEKTETKLRDYIQQYPGFGIRALRLIHLSRSEAEGFYAVHRDKPFFGQLADFMSSGPAVVIALEAPDAIRKWRTLMGATNPEKAEAGTIRKDFGASIERNATHGSDAPETAAFELGYFFPGIDLV